MQTAHYTTRVLYLAEESITGILVFFWCLDECVYVRWARLLGAMKKRLCRTVLGSFEMDGQIDWNTTHLSRHTELFE